MLSLQGTQFSVYLILFAVCGDSDLCVFLWGMGMFLARHPYFPGYRLYLQCIPYGMDVCNTNFLSSHDPDKIRWIVTHLNSVVLLY